MDLGSVPQWLTAAIAVGALIAACVSIGSQREIARKRAAVDFFTKTEMDRETLQANEKFNKAVKSLKVFLDEGKSLVKFVDTQEYWDIRGYLNLHELMAVGINKRVLDVDLCYDFWSGELLRAYADTKVLIEHIQAQAGDRFTYCEMIEVAERWKKRDEKNLKDRS
jgi:Domain of unknown function (DUF4760)